MRSNRGKRVPSLERGIAVTAPEPLGSLQLCRLRVCAQRALPGSGGETEPYGMLVLCAVCVRDVHVMRIPSGRNWFGSSPSARHALCRSRCFPLARKSIRYAEGAVWEPPLSTAPLQASSETECIVVHRDFDAHFCRTRCVAKISAVRPATIMVPARLLPARSCAQLSALIVAADCRIALPERFRATSATVVSRLVRMRPSVHLVHWGRNAILEMYHCRVC